LIEIYIFRRNISNPDFRKAQEEKDGDPWGKKTGIQASGRKSRRPPSVCPVCPVYPSSFAAVTG
jgi:TPP-dependent indolepyruvate ferredoxin oxidoreductase alpha subunit